MKTLRTSRLAVIGALSVAIATTMVPTISAQAAAKPADDALHVAYTANGTATVKSTSSSVTIGPATLSTALEGDGTITGGSFPLPSTPTSFKILGFVPVSATLSFIPSGNVTGALTSTGGVTTVSAKAAFYLKLTNVTVAGLGVGAGNKCQTSKPVAINVATPAGQKFNVTTGGKLAGTFTIGNFANCGLTTPILNLLIPGSGNTIALTLSNGRITS